MASIQEPTNANANTNNSSPALNKEETGVHPSAVGTNTQPKVESKDETDKTLHRDLGNDEASQPPPGEDPYPEQRHAGKVGYGPNYHQKPGFDDKLTGFKEEIRGKITHHPELVQKGHDRITGELKKKEMEEDLKEDPFANPEEKQQEKQEKKSEDQGEKKDQQQGGGEKKEKK